MTSTLESLRECCNAPKSFIIIFDGADTPDLPILVCKTCSGKPLFQKFVKSKQNLSQNQRRCK